MNKDVRRLMTRLVDQGFTYRLTKSGRLVVYLADGQVSSIPTDASGRAMKNYVARLQKAGFRA